MVDACNARPGLHHTHTGSKGPWSPSCSPDAPRVCFKDERSSQRLVYESALPCKRLQSKNSLVGQRHITNAFQRLHTALFRVETSCLGTQGDAVLRGQDADLIYLAQVVSHDQAHPAAPKHLPWWQIPESPQYSHWETGKTSIRAMHSQGIWHSFHFDI